MIKIITELSYSNLLFLFLNNTPKPNNNAKTTIRTIPDPIGIKVSSVDGFSSTFPIVGTKNPNTMNMKAKITIMLPYIIG